MNAVGVRSWTTGFAVRHGDGPVVYAKRLSAGGAGEWQLTWSGGSALLDGGLKEARFRAGIAARLLAEAEPIRAEYERILSDLGREVKGDEGESE